MIQKALIYCRVSSQRQVQEGHGLSGQEKRCRDYARAQGYKVIGVYKDEGVSGGIIDREGMQQLLDRLEQYQNESDETIVIIDDIKRFARDVQGHFTLKTAIYTRNARLESPSHRFEDSPEGKFIETILAGASELERNQNKRQVINRMKARLQNGYWPFCPPDALINTKDPIHGKILVPREPQATIYKKAIESYRDGLLSTTYDVKLFIDGEYKKLNLDKKISHTTARDVLSEILYTGYVDYPKWGIELFKAKHDGFISLDTFNRVQERLQGRTKPWKRRDYSRDFPLRPHVLCAACEKPMTASWNTGRAGKKYPNYFCRRKGCIYNYRVVRKQKLESEFEKLLSLVKPPEEVIDLTKDVLQEQWGLRLEKFSATRKKIRSDIDEATAGIATYLERIRSTSDNELIELYEEEIKRLRKIKQQAEQQLSEKKYTSEEFRTASDKVFDILKNPMSMWKSDDYNDKRAILYMYFEKQLRYDYQEGFRTAGLAYPIKLIGRIARPTNGNVEMSESDPESEY